MGNTELFESLAEKYDSPDRLAVDKVIIEQLRKILAEDFSQKVLLDFGCGTGEVGLDFASSFSEVLLGDTSANMLEVVQNKIHQRSIPHAHIFQLTEGVEIDKKADVIIVSQVLLHVSNTEALLSSLYRALQPKGILVLVDFDTNVQVNSNLVHPGFNQQEVKEVLQKIGYVRIESTTFFKRENLLMGQEASMFCLRAEKS